MFPGTSEIRVLPNGDPFTVLRYEGNEAIGMGPTSCIPIRVKIEDLERGEEAQAKKEARKRASTQTNN
jgi:hypothetical protein